MTYVTGTVWLLDSSDSSMTYVTGTVWLLDSSDSASEHYSTQLSDWLFKLLVA